MDFDRLRRLWLHMVLVLGVLGPLSGAESVSAVNPDSTLDCHRRVYSYRATNTDSQGKICWDNISVMSCWGRCDSNEISDWRFPYKRSHHPVCLHDVRETSVAILKNCDEGVEPGTERYVYLEAASCRCMVCKSSEASCEGLRYRSIGGPSAGSGSVGGSSISSIGGPLGLGLSAQGVLLEA